MAEPRGRDVLLDPILRHNPVALLVLGICSALAVSRKLETAIGMAASVTAVLCVSTVMVSLIRRFVGSSVRILIQITVIASLVIVVNETLAAFFPGLSAQLSVFVGLIVTNCIVMGRTEGFALRHGPWLSFLDGLGNGVGYSAVLLLVAFFRELLGEGRVLGYQVLRTQAEGGWYPSNGFFGLAPSAFILLGLLVWAIRTRYPGAKGGDV